MHGNLLKALDELNRELSSSDTPVYGGHDEKVLEKLEGLKGIRMMFGR